MSNYSRYDQPARRVLTKKVSDPQFLSNVGLAIKKQLEDEGYRVTNVQLIADDWDRGPHVRVIGQLRTRSKVKVYAPEEA